MKTYSISDNTDTIEIKSTSAKAAALDYAVDCVTALQITERVYDDESDEWVDGDEYHVIKYPGTPDTEDEVGDDPRVEFVHGGGPIETDWIPLWQRQ